MISIYLVPEPCLKCLAECAPKCDKLSDQARQDLVALIKETQVYRLTRKAIILPLKEPDT